MQDSKDPKSIGPSVGMESDDAKGHATSSKTLSDVEDNENVSDESGDNANSAPLSPDGSMNSEKNERSPRDDVGPT